jgi:hypothetical protein
MKTKQTFKHSTSLETCGTNETTAYGAHLFHIENISNRSIVGRSRPSKPAVLSSEAVEDGRFGGSPDAGAAVAGAAAAIGRYVCIFSARVLPRPPRALPPATLEIVGQSQ